MTRWPALLLLDLVAFASSGVVMAAALPTPNLVWNVSVPVDSATWQFHTPDAAGLSSSWSWIQSYSESAVATTSVRGDIGLGTPLWYLNTTIVDNPSPALGSALVMMCGNGVWFYGSLSRGNHTDPNAVAVGGDSSLAVGTGTANAVEDSNGPLLGGWTIPTWGLRSWTIGIAPSSRYRGDIDLAVSYADIQTGMTLTVDNPTWDNVNITDIPAVLNGAANPFFNCSSEFSVMTIGPSDGTNVPYDALTANAATNEGANAQCVFTLPANSSYVFFNGTLGHLYSVGALIDITPRASFPKVWPVWATSAYVKPNGLMYATPLDPSVQYTVKFNATTDMAHNTNIGLSGITLYSTQGEGNPDPVNSTAVPSGAAATTIASATVVEGGATVVEGGSTTMEDATETGVGATASHKSLPPTTTVAGGVIGGVLGAALICLVLWLLFRRHRRNSNASSDFKPPSEHDSQTALMGSSHNLIASAAPEPRSAYPPRDLQVSYAPSSPASEKSEHDTDMAAVGSVGSASRQAWAVGRSASARSSVGPSVAPSGRNRREIIAESDAGALEPLDGDEVDRLPPQYDPDWLDGAAASRPVDFSAPRQHVFVPGDSIPSPICSESTFRKEGGTEWTRGMQWLPLPVPDHLPTFASGLSPGSAQMAHPSPTHARPFDSRKHLVRPPGSSSPNDMAATEAARQQRGSTEKSALAQQLAYSWGDS